MERADRLAVLKALGDNTRYAIFLEVARAPAPVATADVATSLDLHPNTVRPHLERMRDVGLLEVQSDARGGVGRPQHRYSLAADAPSLGLDPPTFPLLAGMLMRMAAMAGAHADDALGVGRDQGRADGVGRAGDDCVAVVQERLGTLGFDPAAVLDDDGATIAFTHCPFRDLAEQRPDLLCSLHRGLVEGMVEAVGGGEVTGFGTIVDRNPCHVQIRRLSAAPATVAG